MLGGETDEDEERRIMPDYMKGFSSFGLKTIRLWNDKNGNPQFLDLVRFLPMGDMFDFKNQNGGVMMPQWAMPSGPVLSNAAAWIWNKDLFTGREFVPSYYSDERKTWERVKYTIADHVPAGYHVTRILNGLRNHVDDTPMAGALDAMDITGRNRYGDYQGLQQALVGATGVKVRSFEMREQKQRHDANVRRELSNLDSGHRRMMRDQSLSAAARQKETERYRRARKTLQDRLYMRDEE
ncbi:hypothetical protein [Paralysiella testudinis]|uniref:Uncharacterized protein n=1 Tax=Paralysiella testudinis TaxID=2809020 RepID=A0A892ZFM4_9NEIS|nr:hypothetical protein [Paralysiella testudinis]QRQ81443.1 hypothetical protein JQU52_12125 [Paralysiella testudinis]